MMNDSIISVVPRVFTWIKSTPDTNLYVDLQQRSLRKTCPTKIKLLLLIFLKRKIISKAIIIQIAPS